MIKTLLLFFMVLAHAHAQDLPDLDKQEAYDLGGGFLSLPLKVNTKGEFSFTAGANDLVFTPTIQIGFSRSHNLYAVPERSESLSFSEVDRESRWIETRRLRVEYGLGLSTMLKATYGMGLVPFKGSHQVYTKIRTDRVTSVPPLSMPKTLNDVKDWSHGDSGSFQTYGGVQIYGSIGVPLTTLAQGTLTFQNQFKVGVKKTADDLVELSIEEQGLSRKELKLGPWFLNGRYAKMKGKVFTALFKLNPLNSKHHALFKIALAGNIAEVQKTLSASSQKVEWKGSEKNLYFGIPFVIGQNRTSSEYDYEEDGEETRLNLTSRKNGGLLASIGNHNKYLYQNDESIMLYWSSEMTKTSVKLLKKKFLSVAEAMGLDDFSRSVPGDKKIGSVFTILGVTFSKAEIESVSSDLEDLERNFASRCEELELNCAKEKNQRKVMASVRAVLKTSWQTSRQGIGALMMKEPVLVHAFVKTLNLKKKIFFRFLSGSYQSQEGLVSIRP